MRGEVGTEREPLRTAEPIGSEPRMSAPFDGTVAPLEREQFLVPDRAEPLARLCARSDLHAIAIAQVVDHIHPRRRQLAVDRFAVAPFAHRAQPRRRPAHAEPRTAQRTGCREHIGHTVTARRPLPCQGGVLDAQTKGRTDLRVVVAPGDQAGVGRGHARRLGPTPDTTALISPRPARVRASAGTARRRVRARARNSAAHRPGRAHRPWPRPPRCSAARATPTARSPRCSHPRS
ncbi:hypothetical protein SRABI128_03783 [Microbacterium sp. Bi128]|nr:hypothetical protein SRABI128_03783 [Microbacterium sp. Bi128]